MREKKTPAKRGVFTAQAVTLNKNEQKQKYGESKIIRFNTLHDLPKGSCLFGRFGY